jgi:hypothetical protein
MVALPSSVPELAFAVDIHLNAVAIPQLFPVQF